MTAVASIGQLRFRAVVLLALMFLTGVTAGLGIGRLLGPSPPPPPRGMAPYDRLELTPEQQVRIDAIIENHRADLDAIINEAMPRIRTVQEAIDKEIRTVLTPEQTRKLEEMQASDHRREHPPGPPGTTPPPPPHPGLPGMGPPPPPNSPPPNYLPPPSSL